VQTAIGLLGRIPADRIVITESGILGPEDVALMRSHQVQAFLVGEAFMRAPSPGRGVARLFANRLMPERSAASGAFTEPGPSDGCRPEMRLTAASRPR
jgi:hypothetical protein